MFEPSIKSLVPPTRNRRESLRRGNDRSTVEGFTRSAPNQRLIRFAEELGRHIRGRRLAIDVGCGAGRNTIPLATLGWDVLGIDMSWPMLHAADNRIRQQDRQVSQRIRLARASMDCLPLPSGRADLVVAHGIWNLARTSLEFRRAIREAARVARQGAALFVFTFSRHTLPPTAEPLAGEPFVFTQFSGSPQCFLAADQLVQELAEAGFMPDPEEPLRELNRLAPRALTIGSGPVIYEGGFRRSLDR